MEARVLCGAKNHRNPGTCKRPAGWGTKHPGKGRCKIHGGCAEYKAGEEHPNFKHGLYSQGHNEKELTDFATWRATHNWIGVGLEEEFALFRLQTWLTMPGPGMTLPPAVLADCLLKLIKAKQAVKELLFGKEVQAVEVRLTGEDMDRLKAAFIETMSEYVEPDRLRACLAAFRQRCAGTGLVPRDSGNRSPRVLGCARTDD